MGDSRFQIIGGELCLDFANTADWHQPEEPRRMLVTYSDLVEWGRQLQTLTRAEAERLLRNGEKRSKESAAVLKAAWKLQDTIYRIFAARVAGKMPQTEDLNALNSIMTPTLARQRIGYSSKKFQWEWDAADDALDQMLWHVVRSAVDLLTSERVSRVKMCGECGWLFLDTSKNGSRRWCIMEICGNRAKARRHYARSRKG